MTEIKSNLSSLVIEENIVVLTLDNGPKNLLTYPEFIEKKVLEDTLNENPQVTALIITGAGRHFSHGADVTMFQANSDCLVKAKELLLYIENLPVLTIAAINGGCFGGGLEIALSCQLRMCSKKAFLGLPEINHGVIPGMNGIERLTRTIGKRKTISMVLAGELVNAEDALSIGLVDYISEEKNCFDEALNLAKTLVADKTVSQINAIINLANQAANGAPVDPSENSFDRILSERG